MPLWNPYDVTAAIAAHVAAEGHAKIVTGSYTGDGNAGRQIAVGFKCSFVVIGIITGIHVLMPGHTLWVKDGSFGEKTADVYLHASDGFVVGASSPEANFNGNVLKYWAISE